MEEDSPYDKILEGAELLFMKYGIRSVSMDDISRQLGISKKTLYQHFADKDALVLEVSKRHLQRDLDQYTLITEKSKNAIEELGHISQCLKKDMTELNPSLLFDLQKYHPKAWKLWMDFKERFIKESILRNIRQGQAEGYFRPEINAEVVAVMRLLLIESSFNDEVFPQTQFNLVEVQLSVFDFFLHGLCTDKGLRLYQKNKEKYQTESLPK